jgi:hypothetical protein
MMGGGATVIDRLAGMGCTKIARVVEAGWGQR